MPTHEGAVTDMLERFAHIASSAVTQLRTRGEAGQALVEYSLVLGLLSVIAVFALTTLGGDVALALEKVAELLASV